MRYKNFQIKNYRGIGDVKVGVNRSLVPLIGLNESGKSTVLQALAHFDHRNDPETVEWQTRNRYKATTDVPEITADIEITEDELRNVLSGQEQAMIDAAVASLVQPMPDVSSLQVMRRYPPQGEKVYAVGTADPGMAETIGNLLILSLPWLRYIPDILQHEIPEQVSMPSPVPDDSAGLTVFQLVLKEIFAKSGDISIGQYVAETDSDVRISRLSAVSDHFSSTVIQAWRDMHAEMEQLNSASRSEISLAITDPGEQNNFHFRVQETVGASSPTVMKVSDRSTGFRWYFNFAVMKSYGLGSSNDSVIYLIDEPGSFLHSSAQKTLIETLADLARTTTVVFTTHSEFLLDPEVVNPNDIVVIEKLNREVTATPLSESEMSREHGPMTPAYRALQTSIPLASTLSQKVVVTEGLTDYQFWKMSGSLGSPVFLPGSGAGNNKYLISVSIGSATSYVALFDGDFAGNTAIRGYKKMYADEEAVNWLQYEKSDGTKCQLESLLSYADQQRLNQAAGSTQAKKGITKLFYMPQADKDAFWKGLDTESRANISHTVALIEAILNKA